MSQANTKGEKIATIKSFIRAIKPLIKKYKNKKSPDSISPSFFDIL